MSKSLLIGTHRIDVDAPAGKRITFIPLREPDFKRSLSDFFEIRINEQVVVE